MYIHYNSTAGADFGYVETKSIISRTVKLYVLVHLSFAGAIFGVSLRLFARRIKKTRLAIDDYLVITALIFDTVLVALQDTLVIRYGAGRHMYQLPPKDREQYLLIVTVMSILWTVAMPLPKVAFAILYKSVFPQRSIHRVVTGFICVAILSAVSIFIAIFTVCQPVTRQWDYTHKGQCGRLQILWTAASAIDLALDIALLVIPIFPLWKLQLNRKRRLGFIVIFVFGIFTSSIAAFRLIRRQYTEYNDLSYYTGDLILWFIFDPCTATLTACELFIPIVATTLWTKFKGARAARKQAKATDPLPSFSSSTTAIISTSNTSTMSTTSLHKPLTTPKPAADPSLAKRSRSHSRSHSHSKEQRKSRSRSRSRTRVRSLRFPGSSDRQFRRLQDHLFPLSPSSNPATPYDYIRKNSRSGSTGDGHSLQPPLPLGHGLGLGLSPGLGNQAHAFSDPVPPREKALSDSDDDDSDYGYGQDYQAHRKKDRQITVTTDFIVSLGHLDGHSHSNTHSTDDEEAVIV